MKGSIQPCEVLKKESEWGNTLDPTSKGGEVLHVFEKTMIFVTDEIIVEIDCIGKGWDLGDVVKGDEDVFEGKRTEIEKVHHPILE